MFHYEKNYSNVKHSKMIVIEAIFGNLLLVPG